MKFLFNKKCGLIFLGGMVASCIGKKILETDFVHDLTVKIVATGIKAKNCTVQTIENIKEDAQDLIEESKQSLED